MRKRNTRSLPVLSLSLCSFQNTLTASTARARASWASACSAAVKGFRLLVSLIFFLREEEVDKVERWGPTSKFSLRLSQARSRLAPLFLSRAQILTARRSPRRRSSSPVRRGSRPFRSMNRLVRGTRRLAQNLRSRFFFPSEPRGSSKLQKKRGETFLFPLHASFPSRGDDQGRQ